MYKKCRQASLGLLLVFKERSAPEGAQRNDRSRTRSGAVALESTCIYGNSVALPRTTMMRVLPSSSHGGEEICGHRWLEELPREVRVLLQARLPGFDLL